MIQGRRLWVTLTVRGEAQVSCLQMFDHIPEVDEIFVISESSQKCLVSPGTFRLTEIGEFVVGCANARAELVKLGPWTPKGWTVQVYSCSQLVATAEQVPGHFQQGRPVDFRRGQVVSKEGIILESGGWPQGPCM